ncbi:hypothetical protein ABB37_09760 [Leptomonas pyrrhocoris]|uniref:Uncharacterized protein n=1 Tax=Leptomonas pyrrhocoris TaxID=157538 RepID=A0A0N0VCS0_LEPPY|nr:hypothetical protein ABB37_09760 [Leptomonas pyrrhocoris]KPA73628.1 hypothetical protein ABB37_09760 [Leptomonas pyrrhocoris]|eukprot:XP_015652067.1 hypothetical protein ABB37_09760 [Leptomonas pyrrhocoris]
MRAWLDEMWDRQVGLDEYLPGTPHKHRRLLDLFPYHIWGRSSMPSQEESSRNVTEAERRFREGDAVRRRQYPSCFEEACAYGNLQAAILMWSQGTVDIATRKAVYEGNNASALMWAAFKGHLPVVRFLVDHAAPLEATNTLGHTALQWAITAGHTDVARYLLDHGADPSHRDRQGFDAAFAAVQNDRLALLLMLTEDASREGHLLPTSDNGLVFYQPSPEQRAQAAAAGTLNPRTGKPYYLLDPSMRDVEGHTLMHWAAYRNSPATCQYLLDHWGYAVDAKDKHGRTPFVWAAREGFAEVMELLLSRGADRDCADSDGWTALQYARTRNHPEAVYVVETYPIASMNALAKEVEAEVAAEAGDVFRAGEHEHTSDNAADSAKTALLGGSHSGPGAGAAGSGGRYVCVRDRRAYGTFQMLRTHTMFAVMAACGPLYLVATYVLMNVLPPLVSYFPFGVYFFKNVLWTSLLSRPTQSSRTGPPLSITKEMGIAANIAESVRGTWLFRARDPANFFIWLSFLLLQVWAWNQLGLPPLFTTSASRNCSSSGTTTGLWPTRSPSPLPSTATAAGDDLVPPPVHYVGLAFFRLLTFQSNPLRQFGSGGDGGDAAVAPTGLALSPQDVIRHSRVRLDAATCAYTAQSESIVRWVLMLLLVATLSCGFLCKLLSARSVMRSSEEGTLRTSPLWRIVAARRYSWLHPRFFFQERHMQFPLRAFYCAERDVVVRDYDGYSNLLDCPIGRSNHLPFVLALTSFTLYQLFILTWGYQHMRALLQCPVREPWYGDAFFAFQQPEAMEAALKSRAPFLSSPAAAATSTTTAATTAAAAADSATMHAVASAVMSAAAPVISFAWLNNGMNLLLHGLPCRQHQRLAGIAQDYVHAVAAAASKADGGAPPSRLAHHVRRVFFLVHYYLWPTRASALGVWVLHYSILSALAVGCVAVRQWRGVWSGATRVELANPLAQGSDGELVSIFPKAAQQAQRVALVDAEEERFYAAVSPEKARPVDGLPEQGGRCIYADGSGLVNVWSFVRGRRGQRWRGAMTVSSHNTPVKTPMLM